MAHKLRDRLAEWRVEVVTKAHGCLGLHRDIPALGGFDQQIVDRRLGFEADPFRGGGAKTEAVVESVTRQNPRGKECPKLLFEANAGAGRGSAAADTVTGGSISRRMGQGAFPVWA